MKIFGGLSSFNGFEVWLWDVKKDRVFKTASRKYFFDSNPIENLKNFRKIFRKTLLLLPYFLPPLFLFHYLLFWKEDIWCNIASSGALFLFIFNISMAFVLLRPKFGIRSIRQWHGCEHKLINLLKKIINNGSAENLTVENLEKQGRVFLFCETSIYVLLASLFLMGYIITILVHVDYFAYFTGLIEYLGIIRFFLALPVSTVFLFWIINNIVQYLFFTAKPTKQQLEEAIQTGKEFLKEYQHITNGSLQ